MQLSNSQVLALKNLAVKLQVKYEWLYNLIKFESNFNPLALNPKTNAVGLIQLHPKYGLKDLGLTTEDIYVKYNTFESQLPLIEKYFSKWKPFPTKQSFYMAVFYPDYRYVDSNTLFPQNVRDFNKPIGKVSDYIEFVDGTFYKSKSVFPILTFLALGFILYKSL